MKLQGNRRKQSSSPSLGRFAFKHREPVRHPNNSFHEDKRQIISDKGTSKHHQDEASPSQHLWVGNISPHVTETMLAEQFSRFGDIESLTLYSSKNYAFVSLRTVEDAVYAKKGLHGTVLGGLRIRIEFAKGDGKSHNQSCPTNKSMHGERNDKAAFQSDQSVDPKSCVEKSMQSLKGHGSEGTNSGEPSDVLWVGFPLHLRVDERKLDKHFAPFGEIEKITTFPGRTYAFIKFKNVKDAARAKAVLQGTLFNDPRVSISFAKSEVGPAENRAKGPAKEGGTNSITAELDRNNLPSPSHPSHSSASGTIIDKAKQSSMMSSISNDSEKKQSKDPNCESQRGVTGDKFMVEDMLNREQKRPREGYDCNGHPFQRNVMDREPKRPRVEDNYHTTVNMLDLGNTDKASKHVFEVSPSRNKTQGLELQQSSGYNSLKNIPYPKEDNATSEKGSLGTASNFEHPRVSNSEQDLLVVPAQTPPKSVFRWEGTITKGGAVVCHCRCFPATKEVNVSFPDVLNCSARTNLDMLAQYITQVREISVVLFMPQGVNDVAPYQELMAFLADKKRAAVCKLSEEETLFLVPPSDFVEKFLNVPKSNNILGVVLGQQKQLPQVPHNPAPVSMTTNELLKSHGYQKFKHDVTSDRMATPLTSAPETRTSQLMLSQHSRFQLPVEQNLAGKKPMSFEYPSQHSGMAMENISFGLHNPTLENKSTSHTLNSISDSGRLYNTGGHNSLLPHNVNFKGASNFPPGLKTHHNVGSPSQMSNFPENSSAKELMSHGTNLDSLLVHESPVRSSPLPQQNVSSLYQKSMSNQSSSPINVTFDVNKQEHHVAPSYSFIPPAVPNSVSIHTTRPPVPVVGIQQPQPSGLTMQNRDNQLADCLDKLPVAKMTQPMQLTNSQNQSNNVDENQKRFQATLELAAALLQQLQK